MGIYADFKHELVGSLIIDNLKRKKRMRFGFV